MNNLESIAQFIEISDLLSTGGQPSPEQFTLLKDAGYELVINLGLLESPGALPDERRIVTSHGMIYAQIPVIFEAPQIEEAARFCDLLTLNADSKIFVHCVANKRAACFVYIYRVLCTEVDEVEARRDLERAWQPDAIWEEFIADAIRVLK